MERLTTFFRQSLLKMRIIPILSAFLIVSCEEQINDLWNADDESENVSPMVGDWYADSINLHLSMCNADSNTSFMFLNNIDSYNLWILSDGSFQLLLNQSSNVESVCINEHDGQWDPVNGCGGGYDYYVYEYFTETPIKFCNERIGYNQYDIQTSDCSQVVTLEGTWQDNESSSTVSLTMDPYCANSENPWGMATYQDTSSTCEGAGNQWNANMVRTYSYVINEDTGELSLNWADSDSTCVKFYLATE